MPGHIHADLTNDVATLVLDDPATLNGMTPAMAQALIEALDHAEEQARVIVLRGAGRGFCSGANLGDDAATPGQDVDGGDVLERHYNPLIRRIRALRIPLVTQVHGPVVGLGVSLALMGDVIVASTDAYFLAPFAKLGLAPDSGASFLLTRTLGRAGAMNMLLLGQRLSAAEAAEKGVINRLMEPDQLQAAVDEIARTLAAGPTLAFAAAKRLSWAAVEGALDEDLDLQRRIQGELSRSCDCVEGIAAFRERRAPRFLGR
ncbi:Enoyl-CoA hydratase/isomerase [Sphingobium chlorophenolicum L-1]|uniref:Enoyl-CoA hydratase/isomerase n=1 Tax=Sphingobium chlorophenolicum L-1 TaxID=690566 RepID=F6F3T2_SPHCR|nr:enoyl-CoA hydratase-related protein [Sphingobium chlorophenolicum]AEG51094.1 Enoyl-CoA hydratase/isomerase [Sphingobium chlorophenolicum L-1]